MGDTRLGDSYLVGELGLGESFGVYELLQTLVHLMSVFLVHKFNDNIRISKESVLASGGVK